MAIKLNLLPPGAGAAGPLGKVLNITRMLGVIGLAFFLIFGLGASAFFILSTITLNNLNGETDSLKSQIAALETTETQIILLKDRLAKIKTVQAFPGVLKNLDALDPFISNMGPGTTLSELNIDPEKADMTLTFTSRADSSAFMKSLSESQSFKTVTLTSYSYSPTGGISVEVRLAQK